MSILPTRLMQTSNKATLIGEVMFQSQAGNWTAADKAIEDYVQERIATVQPAAPQTTIDDESRCAVCGWTLADSIEKGCVRGNCSMRPPPERLYAPERAEQEYGVHMKITDLANATPAAPEGKAWVREI